MMRAFRELRSGMIYQKHVFICTNQKPNGAKCCFDGNACALRDYAKQQLKEFGLFGKGKIRVNNAGCLGRCKEGPGLVVYPEGTWYRYETREDIDEIIQSHLIDGVPVTRLLMDKPEG